MAELTPTVAKGLAVAERATPFRNHDDQADRFTSSVYAHEILEFSATEADEWSSYMLFLNEKLQGGSISLAVYNNTGVTLTKGTLVYVSGWNAGTSEPLIAKADANDASTSAQYVMAADLATATSGHTYAIALVTGIDTSSVATVGDDLWLSAVVGTFTATDPGLSQGEIVRQRVAKTKVKHASTGEALFMLPGRVEQARRLEHRSVPLATLREITGADDIDVDANHGGLLTKDSTPIMEYVSTATDSQFRVHWIATDVDPLAFQFSLPPDLDSDAPITLGFRGKMSGGTDTSTYVSLDVFVDEGDTGLDLAPSAFTASVLHREVAIPAADIPSGARTVSVEITPEAHGTDALYIYAIDIMYWRKVT